MTAYDVDYVKWKAEQAELLKSGRFKELDIEHLIEELEMGDPRRELVSDLTILIAHLLKLDIQSDAPDWMKASWYSSIDEHRNRVNEAIKTSGTLRNYLDEAITKAYPQARRLAIKEGQRADGRKVRLPDESEYPQEFPSQWRVTLLDDDWYALARPNQK